MTKTHENEMMESIDKHTKLISLIIIEKYNLDLIVLAGFKRILSPFFTSKFPLKLIYIATDLPKDVPIQAGVSVTKRRFKKAVTRNRIKRLMREAYRLHKNDVFNTISTSYAFMFLYIGKQEPTFEEIEKSMVRLLEKFMEKIDTTNTLEN